MTIDPKIFKAYDIRGLAEGEITAELAERVGRAAVEYTHADTVVVGRDMRETSPELLKALIRGVTMAGADAVDIGLTSTPMFYYAVGAEFEGETEHGAGIMVTASHNPKQYNGLKIVRGNVAPLGEGCGMEQIRDLVIANEFEDRAEGNLVEIDVREEYTAKHLTLVPKRDIGSPRVVFDAGNGMGGYAAEGIIEAYGLDRRGRKMFFEMDGEFPNHVPDPIKPENLVALAAKVRSDGADLGVAYDGDADRVGFVDETGRPLRGDLVTALLAPEVLRQHPGTPVLYDVRSSRAVPESIIAAGGQPVMCRVGHALIKNQMRKLGACFAGELSTHYYFQDFYTAESSDLAMLHLLAMMKRTGKKISEIIAPFREYNHSDEINFKVEDKIGLMKRLEDAYGAQAKEIIRIDGLRFELGSWWFNVRASNTEPLVRLNLEAGSEAEMKAKVAEVSKLISNF